MPKTYGTLDGGREVVVTFDDGPHPTLTPKLLDCLRNADIKAIFFVLGSRVAAKGGKAIVERARNEGHLIGNHTYSHPDLRKLSESEIRAELSKTEELIAPYMAEHKLFRPPFGAHNPLVDRVVREMGYHMVLWSVDPEDWKAEHKSTKWIDLAVKSIGSRGHSVFLCHDIHPTTVNNFQLFIDRVKAVPKSTFVKYA